MEKIDIRLFHIEQIRQYKWDFRLTLKQGSTVVNKHC
mgnify:CR=1 FL=1